MKRFRYRAIDARQTSHEGELMAEGNLQALQELKTRQLTPVSLELVEESRVGRHKRRSNRAEQILLVQELATLLKAGVPLLEAIDGLAEARADQELGAALTKISSQLRAGQSLSRALAETSIKFPVYLQHLAAAGELSGQLSPALLSAAKQMEYDERIRRELIGALIYPSVLVFAGISAVFIIFFAVVPKFANLLKSSKVQMPEISYWVIKTGLFLNQHVQWFIAGVLALIALLVWFLRDAEQRQAMFQRLTRWPVVGSWIYQAERARLAGVLATLLESRVNLVSAIELVRDSLRIQTLREQLGLCIRDLRAGKSLAETFRNNQVLTGTGINLVRVGERSGELASVMRTLAEVEEAAGKERTKRFLALLEPIAILLIGAAIGLIMFAVMGAITSLNTGFGGGAR